MWALACLVFVDRTLAAAVLGGIIILYALFALGRPELTLPEALEKPLALPAGLANGFVNGLTGSQMMPMMPYMMALGLNSNQLVQATNVAFTMSSLIMIAGLAQVGFLTWQMLFFSIGALVPAFVGVRLGAMLRRRVPEAAFRRLILVLLILLGGGLVVRVWM